MSRPSSTSTHLQVNPTVPPAIHSLANPTAALLDAHLPNYLLPNVLTLLRDSAGHVLAKKTAREQALRDEGLLPGKGKGKATKEEEELVLDNEVLKRVERIGLMVGGYIAEKLTLARAPMGSHLDIIKFVCKDLFLFVYSKQIDNLRTNHRGTFVLQSHAFPPLVPLSSYKGQAADQETAKLHLIFPQSLIQGALTRLGMSAIVTAETSGLPQCTFQIRTVKSTPQLAGSSQVPTPALASSGVVGTPGPAGGAVLSSPAIPAGAPTGHASAPRPPGISVAP